MGNFKKKFLSKVFAGVMAAGVAFTGVPGVNYIIPAEAATTTQPANGVVDNSAKYNLTSNIKDGTILHAWCWSFNTIKNNMADIAAAGFSTVQTSPANECNDSYPTMKLMGSDEINGTDGCWWWQYQPTDWKIGNYQLGSRDDFKAMCAEADKYGIKVIVDVIPNHVTPTLSKVSQDLYNAVGGKDNLFHANGFHPITQWGNRYECTTGEMGGLPDVNTENPDFQAYFMTYINDIIDCGADGFRYDTAKHIGVPSDPTDAKSERNNFWPVATGKESVKGITLKDKDRIFNYGEVLQGDNVPEAEYAQYLYQTASAYGGTLRNAIQSKNLSVGGLSDWKHASPDKLVTWVESHDTYCNDGPSVGLTDAQIRMAWAIITARKDGTPLFYSRPDGSNGWSNRWGNNVLGAKGNDQFKSKEVTAVNFFRNAMVGESEYLRNIGNETMQIDRGNRGTVIVNAGNGKDITSPTKMADGTYTDQVSGRTFTVSGGQISGKLDGQSVAVIYNPENPDIEKVDVKSVTGSDTFKTDTLNVKLTAQNVTNATYSTTEGQSGSFTDGEVITVGSTLGIDEKVTVTVKAQGKDGELTQSATFTKIDREPFWKLLTGEYDVYVKKPSGWGSSMKCYAYESETSNNGEWPGVAMKSLGEDIYAYNLPDGWDVAKVIFNDGSNQYPAPQQPGLDWAGKSMVYLPDDGGWQEVKVEPIKKVPSVVSSLADGSSFDTENTSITLTLKNATSGTYCVDNGPVKSFTSSAKVAIGTGKIADTTVTVKTTATGVDETGAEKTVEKTFTFTKKFNAEKNGAYTDYESTNTASTVAAAAASTASNVGPTSPALTGKYATNPNGFGGKKTITGATDFDDSMIIAQGVANDDPRIFRGSHEGPVYDTYALYGAWDDENIYLGWQFTNVTDVVDPAQGYPISDNGKPYNGDIPQVIALNLGTGNNSDGSMTNGGRVWGLDITYDTPIDAMICFSSKPGVGKPSLFTANSDGEFDYANAVGFTEGGISFKYEDGFFGSKMVGVKGNGYAGYTPDMLWSASSNWVDFLSEGHSQKQDTFYTMTVPLKTLGLTKSQLETNGIAVMHISTFGVGGIGSLPMDPTMVDNATEPYSADASTSAEKEDLDTITVPFASLGAKFVYNDDPIPTKNRMTVNFGADRSAPQTSGTALTLKAVAAGGNGTYKYQFFIDGKEVQNSTKNTYAWNATGGDHELEVVVTDGNGVKVTCTKAYTCEGENPPVDDLKATLTASPSGSAVTGEYATLTAKATGGSGSYTYKFLVLDAKGNWFKLRDFASGNTFKWKTGAVGKKTLCVDVKDSKGTVKRASVPFEVKAGTTTALTATLTASPSGSAVAGSTVTLTTKANGGAGNYTYKFLVCDVKGNWYKLRDFASGNTLKWKTGSVGQKTLYVDVKDSNGTVKRASISFEVKAATTAITASLTTSPSGSAVTGSIVTLTAKASGGSGSYTYRFVQSNDKGVSYTISDYTSKNTATWKTGAVGKKTIYVDVKDSNGIVKRVSVPFEVKAGTTTALTATLTASPSGSAVTGSTVTLTTKANGGAGNYTYKFLVCDAKGNWYKLRDFASGNTLKWKTAAVGQKTLYVDVKDSKGTVKRASVAFEVKASTSLKVSATAGATTATAGTTVKFTATATGGAGTYQYRFTTIKDGIVNIFRDYATSNVAYCNPGAGAYEIYVDVKDAAGNTANYVLPFEWKTLPLTINSFKADKTTATVGTAVKFTAATTGGTGTLQYRFRLVGNGKETVIRDYNSSNAVSYTPGAAGTYLVHVDVKDSEGTVKTSSMIYQWN